MAHGGLSLTGKVKSHTPSVPKNTDGKKQPTGRAMMRRKYNRRVLSAPSDASGKKKVGPNKQESSKHS